MDRTTRLLAGAGIGAMMIASGATPAAARAARHHARRAAAVRVDRREEEIEALRQQVEALTRRLDQQQAAQQEAQAAATAAQQQASAAAAAASAAQAQATAAATAVPAEVKTELAAAKPKPSWADTTSISGRMYFNFSHVSNAVNGVESPGDATGFQIKRFYLSVDHKFSNVFSADLTTDISQIAGIGQTLYIKKAYLQAKLNPAFVIRLGSADTPWIPYVENQYGYRYVENTLIDRTKFGTSADWGVHVLGDLAGGLVSYQVSMVDGNGYRNPTPSKSVDFEGRISAQYKGFYGAVGGYSGKLGADTLAVEKAGTLNHTATRFDALLGYKNKLFNVGGEYFYAHNWPNNGFTPITGTIADHSLGYSAFGNVNFARQWSVFGRYDWVSPNRGETNVTDHYLNVGVQYEPVKIVDLALVYKHDKVDNGLISTSNGTIGGPNPVGTLFGGHGSYDEVGLFGQLRW